MPEHSSLWRFATAFYVEPAVRDLCLKLQDEQGLSVDWLLWLLWLERQGRVATTKLFDQAEIETGTLRRNVIEPLRKIRKSLTQPDEATLKQRIVKLELAAERLELRRLQRLRGDHAKAQPAQDNLQRYLLWLNHASPSSAPLLAELRRLGQIKPALPA